MAPNFPPKLKRATTRNGERNFTETDQRRPFENATMCNLTTPDTEVAHRYPQMDPEAHYCVREDTNEARAWGFSSAASISSEDTITLMDTSTPTELKDLPFLNTPSEESPSFTPYTPFPPPASTSSKDTITLMDTSTPTELKDLPFLNTPSEESRSFTSFTPFPPLPPPKRGLFRLPVLKVNHSRADKEVGGGYRLLTVKRQVEAFQEKLNQHQCNLAAPEPKPPSAPRRVRLVPSLIPAPPPKPPCLPFIKAFPPKPPAAPTGVRLAPPLISAPLPKPPCPPLISAPPPKSPHKKRGPRKSAAHLSKVVKENEIELKCILQLLDLKMQEKLHPVSRPLATLSQCFMLLSRKDWEKKIEGLKLIRTLATHHQDTLMYKLLEVCQVVMKEIQNRRRTVYWAATNTMLFLYARFQNNMDRTVERTGRILLLKIAQEKNNVCIQQQANAALAALVMNCSPGRVLTTLLNTGLSHSRALVRASAALQIHLLAEKMGAARVMTAGESFTQHFLKAVAKMSWDAASKVRFHGQAIFRKLALHCDFRKLWIRSIAEKDRRYHKKFLRGAE